MSENKIRCPICGKLNEPDSETCGMCKTLFSKKENAPVSVRTPKSKGKTITIVDIEDPITRKKLEELTLIPGVTRKKALLLYQSGIHSMDDFLQKAFHGDRMSTNYSRTVANKLLVKSLKKHKVKTDIPCPSCNAPNPIDAEKCKVCNFEIKKEMESINLSKISDKLSESVSDILDSLNKSEDFEALPEDMKKELATLVDSDDIEFEMDKPKEMGTLGIDIDSLEEDTLPDKVGPTNQETEPQTPLEKSEELENVPAPKPTQTQAAPEPQAKSVESKEELTVPTEEKEALKNPEQKNSSAKQEKVRKVLTEKMDKWRKSGYDITGLEQYLEDVEGFKVKAKEILSNGKTVRAKYVKQMEMWKEKGFDVTELEPLLDTDIDAFMDMAKDILKKQKKKT